MDYGKWHYANLIIKFLLSGHFFFIFYNIIWQDPKNRNPSAVAKVADTDKTQTTSAHYPVIFLKLQNTIKNNFPIYGQHRHSKSPLMLIKLLIYFLLLTHTLYPPLKYIRLMKIMTLQGSFITLLILTSVCLLPSDEVAFRDLLSPSCW
jgi:hypothetical protein